MRLGEREQSKPLRSCSANKGSKAAGLEQGEVYKESSKGDPGREGHCVRHRPGDVERKQKAQVRGVNVGLYPTLSYPTQH